MNDLTPRKRAENALKAAGFVKGEFDVYQQLWTRHHQALCCTETARFYPDRQKYGEGIFEMTLSDDARHLPAYLNAKALLEACEVALKALDAIEVTQCDREWTEMQVKTQTWWTDPAEALRTAIAKAKGEHPPCNESASTAPPDPTKSP